METNSVSPSLGLPGKQPRTAKKVLDKEDFLKLLVSQLKNQNPLDPQGNEEFISTMAQFSSLETLVSLDKTVQYGQAMAMIDRPVTVHPPGKDPVSGRVERAGIVEGKVAVFVDGKDYKLTDVTQVLYRDPAQGPATGKDLVQSALLIGREVTIVEGQDVIRGVVEKVGLDQGSIRVYVGGAAYDITGITEINAGPGEEIPVQAAGSTPTAGSTTTTDTSGVENGEGDPGGTG